MRVAAAWRTLAAFAALTASIGMLGAVPATAATHAAASRPSPTPTGPTGVPGTWTPVWSDEFDGTNLDTTKWSCHLTWTLNGTATPCSNVTVSGGVANLVLSDASTGAVIASGAFDGAGSNAFLLMPGQFAEARVYFPGGSTGPYNWPAWWTGGQPWPAAGEHDIAEGLGDGSSTRSQLTINYHADLNGDGVDDAEHFGAPTGRWANAFHVFGLYRAADHADVYWDGKRVQSYPTYDTGAGQELLVNVGSGPWGGKIVPGAASTVKVDYVRAWQAG